MRMGAGPVGRRGAADGGAPRLLQSAARRLLHIAAALIGFALAGAVPAAARPLQIVVLGDSLSAGLGLPNGQAFPEVLQRRLKAAGRDVTVVNAGVSGDTAADGLARFDWSVPEGADIVVVELGANDMLRGHDPAATRATLATIFDRVKARGATLVIAGMRSIDNWGPQYRQRFETIYPDLARQEGAPLYPFFMVGIYEHPELVLPDHLHPTAAGVEKMVDGFVPFFLPIVDAAARTPGKAG